MRAIDKEKGMNAIAVRMTGHVNGVTDELTPNRQDDIVDLPVRGGG